VIDEGMQQRVEICVLGTSDLVGRSGLQRRLASAARPRPAAGSAEPAPPPPAAGVAVAPAELALTAAEKNAQDEFGFGEVESRGHFEKTDRNLFDGQDLDVPTYLRKGIKIAL
jgi:cell division protein FtsZ